MKPEIREITEKVASKRAVDMDDLLPTIETLRAARAEIAKWKEVETAAKERITERLDTAGVEYGVIDGDKVVVKAPFHPVTRVMSKELRAAIPVEVLSPYLRTTDERRIELVD